MSSWQWLYNGIWVDCTPRNTDILQERQLTPSLEMLFLANDFGELWGSPEEGTMKFRVHDTDEESMSKVRIAPNLGECKLFQVNDGTPRYLTPEACGHLFENDKPSTEQKECQIGTEKYVAKDGELYQQIDGILIKKRYTPSGLSWGQFGQLTKTRYSWEFKGAFRWERMRAAVQKTCDESTPENATYLRHLFSHFDPTTDDTEYGPFQFNDYLSTLGRIDLALLVMDNYHGQSDTTWSSFGPFTNMRIENARSSGRPCVVIKVRGYEYMILFDSGTGASGAGPVVIRTMRYQKIRESIEEQFEESEMAACQPEMATLFGLLQECEISPRAFLRMVAENEEWQSILPADIRPKIERIINLIQRGSNLSTRLQQFMPPLLEKFKECDLRLSTEERTNPTQLCSSVVETLKGGMSVPPDVNYNWKTMIKFIWEHQSWNFEGPMGPCDICTEQSARLRHCGNSHACLKCWVETLVKTNFTCPFCRQDVVEKGLVLSSAVAHHGHKRKRATVSDSKTKSIGELLTVIHQKYTKVNTKTSFGMRKWFTILLRCNLVNIHQRPKDDQAFKNFKDAMKLFKLL